MSVSPLNNEKELLRRVAGGDEIAFKILFDSFRGKLYHFINGMVKSRETAEEIVMDVFLKIWLSKDMVTDIDNFNAFLFRIAYNKSIDFLRAAAKDHTLNDLLRNRIQLTDYSTADSKIMMEEYESLLREAISLLSPKRRQVYQLSREAGLSHGQIATTLKLSRHTVNNHIVESRRFIQSYLINQMNIVMLALLVIFR